MGIQLINIRKALPILPEEFDQPQLRQHANNICRAIFGNQNSVYPAPKHLHCLCQVRRVRERNKRFLLVAHLLDIPQRDRLALASLLRELVERRHVFFVGVCEADDEQEVGVEVAVVEGACRVLRVLAIAEEDYVWATVFDQYLEPSVVYRLVSPGHSHSSHPPHSYRTRQTSPDPAP
jgi:hypothetical protein